MPAEVATSLGGQLYAQLAQLLAPAGSLGGAALLILEPAGKDIGAMGACSGPSAAEALADLANPIPAAAASFLDTGSMYDDAWNFVLTTATPTGPIDDPVRATVTRVIADNQADFALQALAREDLPGDVYHPVRAAPADWLSGDGWGSASFRIGGDDPDPPPPPPPQLFIPVEVPDLAWRVDPLPGPEPVTVKPPPIRVVTPPVGFRDPVGVVVQPEDPRIQDVLRTVRAGQQVRLSAGIRWRDVLAVTRMAENSATVSPVSPPTSGFRFSFEYRVVSLQRPWLQPQLCHLAGWTIPGLAAGGLSNGQLSDNPGLLPVLTTRMLAVRNLVVEARWSEADKTRAGSTDTLSFGPFIVGGADGFDGSRLSRPSPQVVAWLATVVPACPGA